MDEDFVFAALVLVQERDRISVVDAEKCVKYLHKCARRSSPIDRAVLAELLFPNVSFLGRFVQRAWKCFSGEKEEELLSAEAKKNLYDFCMIFYSGYVPTRPVGWNASNPRNCEILTRFLLSALRRKGDVSLLYSQMEAVCCGLYHSLLVDVAGVPEKVEAARVQRGEYRLSETMHILVFYGGGSRRRELVFNNPVSDAVVYRASPYCENAMKAPEISEYYQEDDGFFRCDDTGVVKVLTFLIEML